MSGAAPMSDGLRYRQFGEGSARARTVCEIYDLTHKLERRISGLGR